MTVNVGSLLSTTIGAFSGKLADSVSEDIAVYRALDQAGSIVKLDGGVKIYENIEHTANQSVGWFDGMDTLNTDPSDPFDYSEYDWKLCSVAVIVSGKEEKQNAGSRTRIVNLVKSRVTNGKTSLTNEIGDGMYALGTESGGKKMAGLRVAVPADPTTGTYGGINRATTGNEFWRTQIYKGTTTGGAATTKSNIITYMNALYRLCSYNNRKPTIVVFDDAFYALYEAALQDLQRMAPAKKGWSGFDALGYKGATVIFDSSMPSAIASVGYFLNPQYMTLTVHKDCHFSDLGGNRESLNQWGYVRYMGFMGNMTLKAARYHGRLDDT